MKICSLGAELFRKEGRTDGRTDRHDKVNGNFFPQFGESALKLKKT